MKWPQILLVVAVALAAAAAVAVAGLALGDDGDGGGGEASLEEYETTLVKARNRLSFTLAGLSTLQGPDDFFAQLDESANVADSAATELANAGVAEGLEDENARLVKALRAFSSELEGTREELSDPAFAGTLDTIKDISFQQFVVVNNVLADIREQGVDVPPLATTA
jgi:hypothetical protein